MRCGVGGCSAERLPGSDGCLAHATVQERRSFLESVSDRRQGFGDLLCYLRVDRELLAEVLTVVPSLDAPLNFTGASFPDAIDFGDVVLRRMTVFDGASFEDDVRFLSVTFRGNVSFVGATFDRDVQFGRGPDFDGRAWRYALDLDRHEKVLSQRNTALQDGVWREPVEGVGFLGDVNFSRAEFRGNALFEHVQVEGNLNFYRADFHKECRIAINTWPMWVIHQRQLASDKQPDQLNEATRTRDVVRQITLREVRFRDGAVVVLPPGEIEATDIEIGDATRFEIGGPLVLDSISFPHPLIVLKRPHTYRLRRELPARAVGLSDLDDDDGEQAEIISLQRSALQAPVIIGSGVDLHRCLFGDTLGLEWLRLPIGTLPLSTHHNRWVLAEEVLWRCRHHQRKGHRLTERVFTARRQRWTALAVDDLRYWTSGINPPAIAGLYRQLRQGLEEARNAPGAADLYYGEMEMRRAGSNGRAEATTLWLYWILSGYGLRAWRSLTVLGAVIGLTALAFHQFPGSLQEQCLPGNECDAFASFGASLVFVTRWSISLPTSEIQGVSTSGMALLVAVRVITPVLVALAFLAIRSRIHR
jgi:hypothetical protein